MRAAGMSPRTGEKWRPSLGLVIFTALAAEGGPPERLMIDSTHLKAHRTAASLLQKGLFPAVSAAPRVA